MFMSRRMQMSSSDPMDNNYKYHKQLKNFLVESINEDLYDMKVYIYIYIYIYINDTWIL